MPLLRLRRTKCPFTRTVALCAAPAASTHRCPRSRPGAPKPRHPKAISARTLRPVSRSLVSKRFRSTYRQDSGPAQGLFLHTAEDSLQTIVTYCVLLRSAPLTSSSKSLGPSPLHHQSFNLLLRHLPSYSHDSVELVTTSSHQCVYWVAGHCLLVRHCSAVLCRAGQLHPQRL